MKRNEPSSSPKHFEPEYEAVRDAKSANEEPPSFNALLTPAQRIQVNKSAPVSVECVFEVEPRVPETRGTCNSAVSLARMRNPSRSKEACATHFLLVLNLSSEPCLHSPPYCGC